MEPKEYKERNAAQILLNKDLDAAESSLLEIISITFDALEEMEKIPDSNPDILSKKSLEFLKEVSNVNSKLKSSSLLIPKSTDTSNDQSDYLLNYENASNEIENIIKKIKEK
jgi:hypothetical protein